MALIKPIIYFSKAQIIPDRRTFVSAYSDPADDSKITSDGDCNHEIKRNLLIGRKAMNNLDRILKSRDITLPTKVCQPMLWFFQWSCMDVRV